MYYYYFKLSSTLGSLIRGESCHLQKYSEEIAEAQTIPPFRSIKIMELKVYHHLLWGEILYHVDVVKPQWLSDHEHACLHNVPA